MSNRIEAGTRVKVRKVYSAFTRDVLGKEGVVTEPGLGWLTPLEDDESLVRLDGGEEIVCDDEQLQVLAASEAKQ